MFFETERKNLTRLHTPGHEEGQPEMVVPNLPGVVWPSVVPTTLRKPSWGAGWSGCAARGPGPGKYGMRELTNNFSPDTALVVTLTARLFKHLTFTHKKCYAESLLPRELTTGETLPVEMNLSLFLEHLFQNVTRPRQT